MTAATARLLNLLLDDFINESGVREVGIGRRLLDSINELHCHVCGFMWMPPEPVCPCCVERIGRVLDAHWLEHPRIARALEALVISAAEPIRTLR